MLPVEYKWLMDAPDLPAHIVEGIKVYGVHEVKGKEINPVILNMVDDSGVHDIYDNDDTMAWCAVAESAILIRAGFEVPFVKYDRLRAKSFLKFGSPVSIGQEMLGDVMVFVRLLNGKVIGHHVTNYIAEDSGAVHGMGGNQGDEYKISRFSRARLIGVRRPLYEGPLPTSVKKYVVKGTGELSTSEN